MISSDITSGIRQIAATLRANEEAQGKRINLVADELEAIIRLTHGEAQQRARYALELVRRKDWVDSMRKAGYV